MGKVITEYIIAFLEKTEMFNTYNGEFITEDKTQADVLFEDNIEEIELYYSKDWVELELDNYIEGKVDIFYDFQKDTDKLEKKLEELEKELQYEEKKLEISGYGEKDLLYLDSLNKRIEKILKIL